MRSGFSRRRARCGEREAPVVQAAG